MLTVSYHVAIQQGETPFLNIQRAPAHLQAKWRHFLADAPPKTRAIDLPEEVAAVLAAVLKHKRMIVEIAVFQKAA